MFFSILTGRNPGHFFEEFEEICIAAKAKCLLNFGYRMTFSKQTAGQFCPLNGNVMSDGGMGMLFEQPSQIGRAHV